MYELDEPTLVPASEVDGLPLPVRRLFAALGFYYLVLREFGAAPGALDLGTTREPSTYQADESPTSTGSPVNEVVLATS